MGFHGANQFKAVARAAIPMRGSHAADEKQTLAVHPLPPGIKELVSQVNPFHEPNHDAVVADQAGQDRIARSARWPSKSSSMGQDCSF